MYTWPLAFLALALVAGYLGFGGVAGAAAGIAELLCYVFLALVVISAVVSAVRGQPPA